MFGRTRIVSQPVPRFDDGPPRGVRIVIEDPDGAGRQAIEHLLEGTAYEVVSCGGPIDLGARPCPLEVGETCAAVQDADVVISSLRLEEPRERTILAAMRRRHAGTPVIVQVPPPAAERYRSELDGCEVVYPFTRESLSRAIREVTAGV